jgi:hypothetical protein
VINKKIAVDTGKEILVKQVVDAAARKVPVFGLLFEGYQAYKAALDERMFKDFVEDLNTKIQRMDLKWDDKWIVSDEGKGFCCKVIASAMNAEYGDKREFFVNSLINGTVSSKITTPEKLKFVDILRSLSRPAIEVLAFMHNTEEKTRGQGTSAIAEQVINDAKSKGALNGMDYYLVYACIVEIENSGLFSTAIKVGQDADGKYHVRSYYEDAKTYTEFTERFIKFVTL